MFLRATEPCIVKKGENLGNNLRELRLERIRMQESGIAY